MTTSPTQFTLGRALYAAILLTVAGIQVFLAKSDSPDFAAIASLIVVVVIGSMRMRSIGYSGWWIILAIVPLVNLVLGYRLFAYPPDYAHSNGVDIPMKLVSWIYGIFFIQIVAAILLLLFLK